MNLDYFKKENLYPKIYGFNKSSEAGPDNFAPTIFLGGCDLRCDYCMNSKLVLNFDELKTIDIENIKEFVIENKSKWLSISGGEVTVHSVDRLKNIFKEIHSWGCKVAISTNGCSPDKLVEILPFINYVTMDIKTDEEKYNCLIHIPLRKQESYFNEVMKSLSLLREIKLKNDSFDYEVRTTLYPPLVKEKEIKFIGEHLNVDEKWVLQPFRATKCMIGEEAYNAIAYGQKDMEKLFNIAEKYVSNVSLRNV